MNKTSVARYISIIGHPAITLPSVLVFQFLVKAETASGPHAIHPKTIMLAVLTIGACIMMLSVWQVSRGRWEHIDASGLKERDQFNMIVSALLLAGGVICRIIFGPNVLTYGLFAFGWMTVIIYIMRRQLKISLHMAYAAASIVFLWPAVLVVFLGLVFLGLLGWSRLALLRHNIAEVVTGALVGGFTAIVLLTYAVSL